jgi:hypothetical protein
VGTYDFYINDVQKLSGEPLKAKGTFDKISMGFYKDSVGTVYFGEFHVYSYRKLESVSFSKESYDIAANTSQPLELVFHPADATNRNAVCCALSKGVCGFGCGRKRAAVQNLQQHEGALGQTGGGAAGLQAGD